MPLRPSISFCISKYTMYTLDRFPGDVVPNIIFLTTLRHLTHAQRFLFFRERRAFRATTTEAPLNQFNGNLGHEASSRFRFCKVSIMILMITTDSNSRTGPTEKIHVFPRKLCVGGICIMMKNEASTDKLMVYVVASY